MALSKTLEEQAARAQNQRNRPDHDQRQMVGEETTASVPIFLNASAPENLLTPAESDDCQNLEQYHHDQHTNADSSFAKPVLTNERALHERAQVQSKNNSSSPPVQPLSHSKSPTAASVRTNVDSARRWNAVAVIASQSAPFLSALAALTQKMPESGDSNERVGADTIPPFVRQAASNALKTLKDSGGTSNDDDIDSLPNPHPNPSEPLEPGSKRKHVSPSGEPFDGESRVSLHNDSIASGFVQEKLTTAAAVDGIGAVCAALVHLLQERHQQNDRKEIVS